MMTTFYRSSAKEAILSCAISFLIAISHACLAQEWPPFKDLRYNEEYVFLEEDPDHSFYKNIKRTVIGPLTLSGGGELRTQYFHVDNEDFGSTDEGSDGYILSRFLLHASISQGRFRLFSQLQAGDAAWKKSVGPVDENGLDLHQLFVDYNLITSSRANVVLRAGRQELLYGIQRLISVRDGPNYRQAFDGLKLQATFSRIDVDAFYTHHVNIRSGVFNDRMSGQVKLWGAYNTLRNIFPGGNVDAYYLGYQRRNAVFGNVSGPEKRHSAGTRIWNESSRFLYDAEFVFQFGKIDKQPLRAWTASLDVIYKSPGALLKPEFGLKTELISGDAHAHDNICGTFNAMFPRGGYFGLAARFGPSNLVDVHPSVTLTLSPAFSLSFDYDAFWRYSRSDGLYSVPGSLIYSGAGVARRYIGDQYSISLDVNPNRFVSFTLESKWFEAGRFIEAVSPGKNILFFMGQLRIRF
jgi:hypothetical protein